jgi:hypothetical protein
VKLKRSGTLIHTFMKERLPNVVPLRPAWRESVRSAQTILPAEDPGGHWGTLGSAIDYRLRYYFPQTL